jgi:hypothetical protein
MLYREFRLQNGPPFLNLNESHARFLEDFDANKAQGQNPDDPLLDGKVANSSSVRLALIPLACYRFRCPLKLRCRPDHKPPYRDL